MFFNQVDVVQSLCANNEFIKELFAFFLTDGGERKLNAVVFIQQSCQISKTLQAPPRTLLYNKCAENGLNDVIEYALLSAASRHTCSASRRGRCDDSHRARSNSFSLHDSKVTRTAEKPLLTTLYESIHREQDLDLKLQFFECVRILLDPSTLASVNGVNKQASHMLAHIKYKPEDAAASDKFVSTFYRHWAADLCIPIISLNENERDEQLGNLSTIDAAVYIHLFESV
jgi:protein phosphatase-4 regulatory subunit 3